MYFMMNFKKVILYAVVQLLWFSDGPYFNGTQYYFMMKTKDGFQNVWKNRVVETLEQIGRFSCFAFMIFNIPYMYFGFFFPNALIIYLIVNGSLLFLYCLIWALCFKKSSVFRSLALSILPSLLFVFSGIMIRSILLIIGSIIFAPCHILLSYKNIQK